MLIGLGASAIGRLGPGYAQNAIGLGDYARRILGGGEFATVKWYTLTANDRLRADVIERLMCDFAVDLGAIGRVHGAGAAMLLASPRLGDLEADGIVTRHGDRIRVAADARDLVRTVAAAFDA